MTIFSNKLKKPGFGQFWALSPNFWAKKNKLTETKTYRWTQKQIKKLKNPTLSLVNAGPPDRVSVLSTKCGGCRPNGLIVASSHKIKQIIIISKLLYAKADSPFC